MSPAAHAYMGPQLNISEPSSGSVASAPTNELLDREFEDELAFFASDHDSDADQSPAEPRSKVPKPDSMHTRLLANIQQDKIRRMGHSTAIRRIHAKLSEISELVDTIEKELAMLVSHV